MSHDHHHHHHGTSGRLGMAFALNFGFTLIELVGAWFTNSTAIAADAVHDLGDSLSLAMAWGLQRVSETGPTETHSYGLARLSLLGALINAAVLLVGGAVVLTETVPRLFDPPSPDAAGMLGLAVLGVLVNGAAMLRVRGGTSLNEEVITWHLLEDVLGWLAVLVVSITLMVVDLPILDPLLSVAITVWIGVNAARNVKRTLDLFLQAVPEDVDIPRLREVAAAVDGVRGLRHVHVWSQEGTHHVLTGQLLVEVDTLEEACALREQVRTALQRAGVHHVTLEVTTSDDDANATCHGTPVAAPHHHHAHETAG